MDDYSAQYIRDMLRKMTQPPPNEPGVLDELALEGPAQRAPTDMVNLSDLGSEVRSSTPGEPLDSGEYRDPGAFARSGGAGQFEPTLANNVKLAVPGANATLLGSSAIPALEQAAPQFAEDIGAFMSPAVAKDKKGADEDLESVKALQRKLRDAGLYSGEIDGQMKRETKAAAERFQILENQRLESEQRRLEAENARGETTRLREAEKRAAERLREGEERLRKVQSDVPWMSKALRNYGPLVGLGAGFGVGAGAKYGLSRLSDFFSKKLATKADDIMAEPAKSLSERVGRVNDFWTTGQKGARNPQAPFTRAPQAKGAFKANKSAPEASALYQPSMWKNLGTDAAAVGGFGVEAGIGHHNLESAKKELAAAEEAISKDLNEATIQRLETAKNNVAIWTASERGGLSAMGGYLFGAKMFPRNPTRPNTQKAEAERGAIDKQLAPKRAAKKPAPKQEAIPLTPEPQKSLPAPKFVPGVRGEPRSGLSAKGMSETIAPHAEAWMKANPKLMLRGNVIREIAERNGIDISARQATAVAARLRKTYGERYINRGAKAAITKKPIVDDGPPLDANGIPIKPPKDIDPSGPGNF